MPLIQDTESRCAKAKALASSPDFREAEQIAWACGGRPGAAAPTRACAEDLACALIDAVERHGCPEFVCALLAEGAIADCLDDDGHPLWRSALRCDAMRPPAERCAWMIVARLCLGEGFLRDPGLPSVKRACEACVEELEDLLRAQDEHFCKNPDASSTSALYAILEARHDCAMGGLMSEGLLRGSPFRRRSKPPRARGS